MKFGFRGTLLHPSIIDGKKGKGDKHFFHPHTHLTHPHTPSHPRWQKESKGVEQKEQVDSSCEGLSQRTPTRFTLGEGKDAGRDDASWDPPIGATLSP